MEEEITKGSGGAIYAKVACGIEIFASINIPEGFDAGRGGVIRGKMFLGDVVLDHLGYGPKEPEKVITIIDHRWKTCGECRLFFPMMEPHPDFPDAGTCKCEQADVRLLFSAQSRCIFPDEFQERDKGVADRG